MITDIIKQAREMLERCSEGPHKKQDAKYKSLLGSVNAGKDVYFRIESEEEFIAFARNNLAAILDEVKRLRDALAYCAYNPATNKNWNSHDQLIEGINRVNETARKALEGEG